MKHSKGRSRRLTLTAERVRLLVSSEIGRADGAGAPTGTTANITNEAEADGDRHTTDLTVIVTSLANARRR